MTILTTLGALIGAFWALVAGAWLLAMAGAAFVLWCYWGTNTQRQKREML